MKRRDLLKMSVLSGFAAASTQASASTACATDGTPNQFIPKKPVDAKPLENEFEKYPKCPYCGMDRKEHHRTRMLVQYGDDLSRWRLFHPLPVAQPGRQYRPRTEEHLGAGFRFNSRTAPAGTPVDGMVYLIGADLKHAMTKRSASIPSLR